MIVPFSWCTCAVRERAGCPRTPPFWESHACPGAPFARPFRTLRGPPLQRAAHAHTYRDHPQTRLYRMHIYAPSSPPPPLRPAALPPLADPPHAHSRPRTLGRTHCRGSSHYQRRRSKKRRRDRRSLRTNTSANSPFGGRAIKESAVCSPKVLSNQIRM